MKLNKDLLTRVFLIVLGLGTLTLAYQDWASGVATRRGVDLKESEDPILYKSQVTQKLIFGVIFIGLAFLPRKKDK